MGLEGVGEGEAAEAGADYEDVHWCIDLEVENKAVIVLKNKELVLVVAGQGVKCCDRLLGAQRMGEFSGAVFRASNSEIRVRASMGLNVSNLLRSDDIYLDTHVRCKRHTILHARNTRGNDRTVIALFSQ